MDIRTLTNRILLLLCLLLKVEYAQSYRTESSYRRFPIPKTVGQVWPKPRSHIKSDRLSILSSNLILSILPSSCRIIEFAFDRHMRYIPRPSQRSNFDYAHLKMTSTEILKKANVLTSFEISVESGCKEELPSLASDEYYTISVDKSGVRVSSKEVWGALRAINTFSQLAYFDNDSELTLINDTEVKDWPRFPVRSFMIDTSRHFLNLNTILKHLDAMEAAKMNMLHWHIVDDHSFPFQSKVFPNLSNKGAYNQHTHIYSHEHVAVVVEYARLRGIRVVPEFDTPGHVRSWGVGHPELVSKCLLPDDPKDRVIVDDRVVQFHANGPLDPTKNSTYDFMKKLLGEVNEVFPDDALFLGGDEVPPACWNSNPMFKEFMRLHGISTYAGLEVFYVQKLLAIVEGLERKRTPIVWQEVFDNGANLKKDVVVDVWKGWASADWPSELGRVTSSGHRVILSAPWYLNYIGYGEDWRKYYTFDPTDFRGTQEQKKLVLGGEACMWGEYVDSTVFLARTWPRAAAVAERLWSDASVNNPDLAEARLAEFRCRLIARGIPAEPVAPGHCDNEWPRP